MGEKTKVTLYTDGACSGNPGTGGYGAILVHVDSNGVKHEKEFSQGYQLTTNNQMELLAVIVGLEALKKPCSVTVYSDSKYVVDAFNNKWSNNYASSVMTIVSNVTDNTFNEPVPFITGDYPEGATRIVQSAGLTDEYKPIVELAGENLYPLTFSDYYNNMLHDEDNHHILPWYLKKIYNTSFIDSANKWIELATAAGYNSEAIAKLQTAVDAMVDTEERTVIFEQCNTIREAMNEFSQSIK